VSIFRTRRRVEFADTDVGGLVHFSRFFVFMETAEHELLRSLGTEVHSEWEGRTIGWPRVGARCRYLAPVRFGEELEIVVRVRRKGHTSMTYAIEFLRQGETVAEGELSSVCCVLDGPDGPRPVPIPPFLAERLEEAG
jgi:4-hydroxybenzoyl-CoA thioesterase/acyl-CoA thioester hydrolase